MKNPAYSLLLIQTATARMENRKPKVHRPYPFWVVESVTSGQYEVRTAGTNWTRLGEGDGILYRPGVGFEERVPKGLCRSFFAMFEFDDTLLPERLAGGRPVARLADPFTLARSALESLQQFGDSQEDLIGKQGYLCRMIHLLATARFEGDRLVLREKDNLESRFSDRVDSFMRKNLHQPLRIADIAAHMNISASGLQHSYRRETGTSPMRSLRSIRIEKAKAMLMKEGTGLDAIACETGFSDAFHLSRSFKALVGIPPKVYRQRQREKK